MCTLLPGRKELPAGACGPSTSRSTGKVSIMYIGGGALLIIIIILLIIIL